MEPFSLITGGLGLLSGIGGGIAGIIQANQAQKEAAEKQKQRDADNLAMFTRQYYQDALSRADTQNMLRRLRNDMREAVEQQNQTAVVTGQTPEAVAATKQANAKAYADAVADIDATNARRKDAALAQYQSLQNQSFADWINNYNNQAQHWSNFASQAFNTGAASINTLSSGLDDTADNAKQKYAPVDAKPKPINKQNIYDYTPELLA